MSQQQALLIISIVFVIATWGFVGYKMLQSKFSGRGTQVIKNMLKETLTFDEAIQALKDGKHIRRKTGWCGFTRILIIHGNTQTAKYGCYRANDPKRNTFDPYFFSIEDVLATDWIIDE